MGNFQLEVMLYKNEHKIFDDHVQSITFTKDNQLHLDYGTYSKRFKRSEYDYFFVLIDHNA